MTRAKIGPTWAFVLLLGASALAQHSFPTSRAETQKAERVAEAVAAGDQAAVTTLTGLLGDENARVQTAALVGLLGLSHKELDFRAPLARVGDWRGPRPAFLRAALKAAEIALDKQAAIKERLAGLIELTGSERGFERRMAVEALRGHREEAVLRALEALANDRFEDGDGDFDVKAVGRVAFEVWWPLRIKGVDEDERPPILVKALRLGEPYGSRWCAAACEMLAKEPGTTLPLLTPLVTGKDRRSKLWAMHTLRDIGGTKTIRTLQDVWVNDLGSKDWLERDVARRALIRHPDLRALPQYVRPAVKDDELYEAWKAVHDLGKQADEESLRELRKAAEDHRELVRTQAAAQLAHRGQAGAELTVLTGLTSETEIVRLIARWGLPCLPDHKKVHQHVIGLLKVKPDEAKLPERTRDRLRKVRLDMLQDIYAWDRERQEYRPLVYAIRDLLENRHFSGWALKILRKQGYQVEWRNGKFKVVSEPK